MKNSVEITLNRYRRYMVYELTLEDLREWLQNREGSSDVLTELNEIEQKRLKEEFGCVTITNFSN